MKTVALAGGIGAGKFLRGLAGVVSPSELTVVVNVADDVTIHGLHVAPDPDSVTYWLGGVFDRERGWGRRDETFRASEELRAFGADDAWFSLGDLDLATHLHRTRRLAEGATLSEVTAGIAARFGVEATILPVSNDPITTRIDAVDGAGRELDLHFQEYWVRRRAADEVKSVRYAGAGAAAPAPGVLDAIAAADVLLLCPSNPVVSIGPILAVPGVRAAVEAARTRSVAVSPIVGGRPVAGMADRLMPAAGIEVSAPGVAAHYRELIAAFLMDEVDAGQADRVEALGVRCAVADTIMVDDATARSVARAALDLLP
jgi:LPPG:FO 2-phospho-L-lactate transferase